MSGELPYEEILAENARRWEWLEAKYDPVTGEGCPGDRAWLEIPDFAIPKQFVPKTMLKNEMVKKIVKCGTIASFIEKYAKGSATPHDIELSLRRIRHRHDYLFWAYFCFPILYKTGGEGRFILNRAQLELDEEVEKLRLARKPIDIILDKARQFGGSTYFVSKQTWILLKHDNYHSFVIAAHLQSSSENIQRMIRHAISKYPAWDLGLAEDESLSLLPDGKTGVAHAIKDSKGNKVIQGLIYIGTAQNPDSIRSSAVSGAHFSECAYFPNTEKIRPEELIASISGSILKRHLSMQVYESTAKTSDDFFHDMYISAKRGESSYKALFIPWYHIKHDTIPIDDHRAFIDWLFAHKDDTKPTDQWKDPGSHYWMLWESGATLEGINWYRYKRRDFSTYAQMANEAPSNDVESFQSAGSHVFDIYQVEALRKYFRQPAECGHLVSNDRRDAGVLKGIRFVKSATGNLLIYERPDKSPVSNRYVVSVDIGGIGPNSDYHSVRVMDRLMMMPDYGGIPQVVAEMHYHCKRDDLVFDAVRLAKWYNDALLVIESNTLEMQQNSEGDGSQYVLDKAAEIYGAHLYCRESPPEDITEGAPRKWGFHTNAKTKPLILDFAQWAISERAWDEPSEHCLDEFSMYVIEAGKYTAPKGKHDDILMSTCILLWVCYHDMPLPRWIDKSRKKPIEKELNIATF